jgi:AcrR family transcriptional regulator
VAASTAGVGDVAGADRSVNRPIRSVAATVAAVARPFRQQIDEGILDRAAALFARRGFAKTSVADVAAAVGLSKAGLLHHFPSKEALHEAVRQQADALGERVLAEVRDLPEGSARDRRALEALVDVALAHPGLVALMLAPALQGTPVGGPAVPDPADEEAPAPLEAPKVAALAAFAVDPATAAPERLVRVVGALSALAVLTLAAHAADSTTAWRPHVVATCFDALGHRGPGEGRDVPTPSDQVEA